MACWCQRQSRTHPARPATFAIAADDEVMQRGRDKNFCVQSRSLLRAIKGHHEAIRGTIDTIPLLQRCCHSLPANACFAYTLVGGAVGNAKPSFSRREVLICAWRASRCGAGSCVNAFVAETKLGHEHVHRRVSMTAACGGGGVTCSPLSP
jgi:hypothetical protein